jgi:pyruvate/2-oxoglutarate dehydrogenase complex dihydrolipoamide dehydrogenase (E3) component
VQIAFDQLLVATGRRAATAGLGLEALGIGIRPDGTVETDRHLRTALPSVYAAGDVAGPYQFTHTASHQAWYAAVNALFGEFRRFAADYSAIPWCTFTDPEVARVGLSEQEATARGIAYEVTTFGLEELDRAIVDGAAHGVVKVLTVPGKDRILGATIVGEHAGELITELTLAMRHGLGLGKLLSTIHVYPTWAEANRYVAGAWKRRHAPQGLLRWVGRYHAWRRGGEGGA